MIELPLPWTLIWGYCNREGNAKIPVFHDQVDAWCNENLTEWRLIDRNGYHHPIGGHTCLYYPGTPTLVCSQTEAVMFKLRWAQQFAGAELD